MASVWAPAFQDSSHVGAGVGVIGMRRYPVALPSFATAQFRSSFDCGRAVRCMLPLGAGRFMHLFVIYCHQGADTDAGQLAVTEQLFDAALGELSVVAREQPCMIVGDFNVEPTKILLFLRRLGQRRDPHELQDVTMLARQWCRCETFAGQRQRECERLQSSVPHGCPRDRRSTVRLPRRVRADTKTGTPPQDLLCRFRDLHGQVADSAQERVCRRLEQSHRPRTRLTEMWSTRAPATDLLAQPEDAQLDGRGGLVAYRLLCAITPQGHLATGEGLEVV